MNETDPHIHVEQKVLSTGPHVRNLMSSALDRVPESVTCLPCREHASREYFAFAELVEGLGAPTGMGLTAGQIAGAVERLRDLARRFSGRTG